MKLEDLKSLDRLVRPEDKGYTVPDGAYNGVTQMAELAERDSKYSKDGKRVVLNIMIEVQDSDGQKVRLYVSPTYTWSKRGNMVKIFDRLGVEVPPGEGVSLEKLVNIPVQVVVENVVKDGVTYSNVVSIKRTIKKVKKPIKKKNQLVSQIEEELAQAETEEDDDDYSDFENM